MRTTERLIHVDHPEVGSSVRAACVFDGWTISPVPSEILTVTINGGRVASHPIERPDVEAVYPGENAKGFMFFFNPDPNIRTYDVRLTIGDVERKIAFSLDESAVREAEKYSIIQDEHTNFLRTALACPNCRAHVDGATIIGRVWKCIACSEVFDCSDGLNLIPTSHSQKVEIGFHGAICANGYDQDVEALIDNVAAAGGMVLDCGAGWRSEIKRNVITMEILRYPSTDVVGLGEHLPFRDCAFDAVLSLNVLEHVKNPFVCAAELTRVLRPGGTLYVVTPYIVGVHGFPFHFFNPTPSGLRALFEDKVLNADVSVPHTCHALIALHELLTMYATFYSPQDRELFRSMSIGSLIDLGREGVMSGRLATGFSEEGNKLFAGNYRIVGTKT